MITSRETILSLLYRIGSIGLSFVSVSYLVKVLGPEKYGAWATLVSALVWIQLSDFGIGNVIKNRVAAQDDPNTLREQITIAMCLSFFIGLALISLYAIFWRNLSIARDFPIEAALLYTCAFLILPTTIGTNILQGLGQARVVFQASMLQGLVWLALMLSLNQKTSIMVLAIGFSILWMLLGVYQCYRAFKALGLHDTALIRRLFFLQDFKKKALPLLKIGGAFFLLQITSLVLFNLGTYLAYTAFSATAAAKYDILSKVYQIPMTLFNVVITVAWSKIAMHASQRDVPELKKIQYQLLITAVVGAFLLFLASQLFIPQFIYFYSHGQIDVTAQEVQSFSGQVAVQMLAYTGAVFMNALERLRLQIVFAAVSALVFVPIFYALQASGMGVASIPIGTMLILLPSAIYFNFYTRQKIIAPLAVR
jgi:O-antigen/teichoic acid export membrane protein